MKQRTTKDNQEHGRSPSYPDPHESSGDVEELQTFEKDLSIKLRQNKDWWLTEQHHMGYVVSMIGGNVKTKLNHKIEKG